MRIPGDLSGPVHSIQPASVAGLPHFSSLPCSISRNDTSSLSSPQLCDNMAYGGTAPKNSSNFSVRALSRRIFLVYQSGFVRNLAFASDVERRIWMMDRRTRREVVRVFSLTAGLVLRGGVNVVIDRCCLRQRVLLCQYNQGPIQSRHQFHHFGPLHHRQNPGAIQSTTPVKSKGQAERKAYPHAWRTCLPA